MSTPLKQSRLRWSELFQFGNSLHDDRGVGIDLSRRVPCSTESVSNLVGRELCQKSADPLDVRPRYMSADPLHFDATIEIGGRDVNERGSRRNVEIDILRCGL